jgi:hypothetical protein
MNVELRKSGMETDIYFSDFVAGEANPDLRESGMKVNALFLIS